MSYSCEDEDIGRYWQNFAIFTGKQLFWSLFLINLQACNFIKKRLQQERFSGNIANFIRTPILKNI